MQKDFMSMAQQAPMQDDTVTDQDLMDSGLPTGNDENAIKGRIMALLEKFGVFQQATPEQQNKLEKEALKLAKAIIAKDIEAIEASPLNDIFETIVDEENAQLEPSEEDLAQIEQPTGGGAVPQQGAAPTDFTSMMPGGGMSGGR